MLGFHRSSHIWSKNTELVSVSIGIMGFVVLLIALEHSNMSIDYAHNISIALNSQTLLFLCLYYILFII